MQENILYIDLQTYNLPDKNDIQRRSKVGLEVLAMTPNMTVILSLIDHLSDKTHWMSLFIISYAQLIYI